MHLILLILSICFGDSVTVGGNTYDQTGTYYDVLLQQMVVIQQL